MSYSGGVFAPCGAMNLSHFDFIVVGGGSAGMPIAHDLAAAGKEVALIERQHMGGSCINFGCTPTKDVLASAKLAFDIRRATQFGIRVSQMQIRFDEVIHQARQLVEDQKTSLLQSFQNIPHLTVKSGHARLEGLEGKEGKDEHGHFRVKVGDSILTSEQVILDTGSRSFIPQVEGMDSADVLSAENWLELSELPSKVAFLGSGYIGLEMGQFYRRMGSEVVLLEAGPQILSHEDLDIAEAIHGFLQAEGVQFRLGTHLKRVEGKRGRYRLTLSSGEVLEVSHLFVATGRKPNTDDLGLESVGLSTSLKGFVDCDSRLATQVKGLWVAGDIRGGPLFTHSAWDDYRVLKSQLLEDGRRTTTDRVVPYAVFIDPELGRVGMTEQEARMKARRGGVDPTVSYFNFSNNLKSKEIREAKGFIKLVVDSESEQILGAAVLGPLGGELIHIYSTLMSGRVPYSVIRDEIMTHPTLSEAVQSAVLAIAEVKDQAISKAA
jgi:pyruvate/2-oxoglutarate dehydrogenase complex dihydrolipoamide dehydrogenase (E3) component